MKIRNVELEFDFNDADDMEKLENAIEKTQKALNNIDVENKKASEVIRETCKNIFDCFNEVFGEDTDKKVFGGKTNFNIIGIIYECEKVIYYVALHNIWLLGKNNNYYPKIVYII